jgi:hypothetical protein
MRTRIKSFETENTALGAPKFNTQNCDMMENVVSRFGISISELI